MRRFVSVLSFLTCALVFTVPASVRATASAAVKIPLALNWKPEPQFGGFYSAHVAGHDLKNGVDFDLLPGGAGTPVVQMVAAGKMDFGIASADEVIIARAHGADVVALFAAYQTNPQAIMTHAERGFKTLADVYAFKGPLAIQKGLPYAMFLSRKYATSTKAQIVPYLGGIQNFLADPNYSQQCFATSEPLSAEKQGAKVKTFLIADEGYNPYTTVLIVRGDRLKKDEKAVRAVVAAVRAGWREYLDHPEKANEVMGKLNTSVSAETFKSGGDAQKSLIETAETKSHGLGTMTAERWSLLRQQLIDMKLVGADAAKADVRSYFQNF